ncbi:MAG TPA: protein kinase [Blastocatellia bacterium]|nr:protein kinase [Blastocatellia bacterium]
MKFCPTCQQSYPSAQRFCLEDGTLLSLPDPYHLVGRTLADRYRIEALVGIGGMGAVYRAHHCAINREVAIKILQPNIAIGNERVTALFEREARTSGLLMHENIASIFDAGRTPEGIAYIAMEWLEGHTLDEELAQTGSLSFERTAEILRPVAAALSAAHRAHVIHRDLKPSNVMLVRRPDGSEQLKVLDFGIAKVVNETAASPVSALMGTPNYASPEQFKVGSRIDGRADIYSLGVMLFQMLTGALPFAADSIHELVQLQMLEPPPLLRQLRPDAPPALEQLISRMLEKDPARRPQSASEIPILFERAFSGQSGPLAETPPEPTLIDSPALAPAQPAEAKSQPLIQTIVTPVRRADSETAKPSASGSVRRVRRAVWLSAGVCLALALMAVWFFSRRADVVNSIAVLPFVNQRADPDAEYLSDGISESLISSLSRLPGLRVIARSSVVRYKTAVPDPQQIGRELNVRAVLVGQVMQQGEEVAINAELVDTRDNTRLWGEKYVRRLTDLLALQEEITKEISTKLRSRLSGEEQKRVSRRPTDNAEAYQLYLKGRYYWNKRTPDSLKQSVRFFQQAIDKDPLYALAWAGMADAYLILGPVATATLPASEAMPKQRAAALEAIRIDDTLAEAHTSLAVVRMIYDWDWSESEREFRRAIELNPNYALAHQWYASLLSKTGRTDAAIAEYQRAQELDPFSRTIPMHLGVAYFYGRRYDQAIAHFRRLLEDNPKSAELHADLSIVYEQKKMYEEAVAEINQALALSERSPDLLGALGRFLMLAGRREEAQKVQRELLETAGDNRDWLVDLALYYAGVGNPEQAVSMLQKAAEDRSPLLRDLKVHPVYDPLRSDPRFVELVRRVGLER